MQNLKDIKPLILMGDFSLMLLIVTLIVALLIAYILFKRVYKATLKQCKIDCQKYYYHKFCSVDWSKPKEAAYLATKYGLVLAKDRRRKELFLQLRQHLQQYKYKENVDLVDQKTLNYYELYKQVCDESI